MRTLTADTPYADMATATLSSLLSSLESSVTSAAASLPEDTSSLKIEGGISLFDTKNELFLSYLHNLVFLILYKIREKKSTGHKDDNDVDGRAWDDTVKNLVGLRLYSDKGVKPLENKLRYEIDRVIQAAEDAARVSAQIPATKKVGKSKKALRGAELVGDEQDDVEGGSGSGSEDESAEDEEDEDDASAPAPASRANAANLALPASYKAAQSMSKESSSGAYRPPRIAPTAMPTSSVEERKSRARPMKSRTMDEYIDEEISGAPTAMPSIGSNIVRSGRRTQTTQERKEDMERSNYEETNYVRLPALSKKEKRQREGGGNGRSYGGEEWRDIGADADRVMKSLGDGRRKPNKLEQSRKRGRDEADGSGPNGMSSFEKRKRRIMERQNRQR